MSANVGIIEKTPIRNIKVVVDLEDIFNPEMSLEDFMREYNVEPKPPRYKLFNIQVICCPEDNNPMLVTECGRCSKFIRMYEGKVFCRNILS